MDMLEDFQNIMERRIAYNELPEVIPGSALFDWVTENSRIVGSHLIELEKFFDAKCAVIPGNRTVYSSSMNSFCVDRIVPESGYPVMAHKSGKRRQRRGTIWTVSCGQTTGYLPDHKEDISFLGVACGECFPGVTIVPKAQVSKVIKAFESGQIPVPSDWMAAKYSTIGKALEEFYSVELDKIRESLTLVTEAYKHAGKKDGERLLQGSSISGLSERERIERELVSSWTEPEFEQRFLNDGVMLDLFAMPVLLQQCLAFFNSCRGKRTVMLFTPLFEPIQLLRPSTLKPMGKAYWG